MKTLKEIKDQVAVNHGFHNWKHMSQNSTITERDSVNDHISMAYATSVAQQALNDAADNLTDCHASLSAWKWNKSQIKETKIKTP